MSVLSKSCFENNLIDSEYWSLSRLWIWCIISVNFQKGLKFGKISLSKSLLVIQNISFSLSDFIKNIVKASDGHAVVNNNGRVTSDVQSCSLAEVNSSAKDMSGTISWQPLNLLL